MALSCGLATAGAATQAGRAAACPIVTGRSGLVARPPLMAAPPAVAARRVNTPLAKRSTRVAYKEGEAPEAGGEHPTEGAVKTRNVIVAVDDSMETVCALVWAMEHMYRPGDVFHVVHCVPELTEHTNVCELPNGHLMYVPSSDSGGSSMEEVTEQVKTHISGSHGAKLEAANVPFEIDVLTESGATGYSIGELICNKAEELDAAAVVVASHGKSAITEFFLGSISNYCVHHCAQPVVVLHHPERLVGDAWTEQPDAETSSNAASPAESEPAAAKGRNIVVAVDETPQSESTLAWTLDNVYRENDMIRLVHVVPMIPMTPVYGSGANGLVYLTDPTAPDMAGIIEDTTKVMSEHFEAVLSERGIPYDIEIVSECMKEPLNSVGRAVCDTAERVGASLVVMGAEGKVPMEEFLLGSVSAYCTHHMEEPLIIIH